MRKVLYDTNVILDVLLHRDPFFLFSSQAIDKAGRGRVAGYLSGHAVTTIAYILQREMGQEESRLLIGEMLTKIQIAPVNENVIRQALNSLFKDFEDGVTYFAACEIDSSVIVTRNVKDFSMSHLPIILPEVFVQE